MNSSLSMGRDQRRSFQLRFQSLVDAGHAYVFPCDDGGRVDLDALGERSRNDYFYARAVVGRELSLPKVVACGASSPQL